MQTGSLKLGHGYEFNDHAHALGDAAMKRPFMMLAALLLLCVPSVQAQSKRDTAVRADKTKLANDDTWFYDDLEKGIDAAAKTKRPLMVVFR